MRGGGLECARIRVRPLAEVGRGRLHFAANRWAEKRVEIRMNTQPKHVNTPAQMTTPIQPITDDLPPLRSTGSHQGHTVVALFPAADQASRAYTEMKISGFDRVAIGEAPTILVIEVEDDSAVRQIVEAHGGRMSE